MIDSFISALGRDDAAGLPPVLDLFLAGPDWLAFFYPALVVIGSLLVAHLVAVKRLPNLGHHPVSKVAGLPMAMMGLGLSIYVLKNNTPTIGIWQTWLWQAGAVIMALWAVTLVALIEASKMRRSAPGRNIHTRANFRSPVRIVWFVTSALSIYLGLTVGVAAIANDAAPRWMQYVIVGLGVLWAVTLLGAFTDDEIRTDSVYPPYFLNRRIGTLPASSYGRYDRTDHTLADDLFSDDEETGGGRVYGGSVQFTEDLPVHRRPSEGWPKDTTHGGSAQPLDAPRIEQPPAPAQPAPAATSGSRYDDLDPAPRSSRVRVTPASMPQRRTRREDPPGDRYDTI